MFTPKQEPKAARPLPEPKHFDPLILPEWEPCPCFRLHIAGTRVYHEYDSLQSVTDAARYLDWSRAEIETRHGWNDWTAVLAFLLRESRVELQIESAFLISELRLLSNQEKWHV